MVPRSRRQMIVLQTLTLLVVLTVFSACTRSYQGTQVPVDQDLILSATNTPLPSPTATATQHPPTATATQTSTPHDPLSTPTPDPIRQTPEIRDYYETHVVRWGDTLNRIAYKYGVGVKQIQLENNIYDPNLLSVGLVLSIPPPIPQPPGPSEKLIPDSELVLGPFTTDLESIYSVIEETSYLQYYVEVVEDDLVDGPRIVQIVAESYSISPRLLLAILHQQSGWVQGDVSESVATDYPIGWYELGREGLFSQLSWAANRVRRSI